MADLHNAVTLDKPLAGATVTIRLSREFHARLWVAVCLARFAVWVAGGTSVLEEAS